MEPNSTRENIEPQKSESRIADSWENEAGIVKSRKDKWRSEQAVGAAAAREIDRDIRVQKYNVRKAVHGPIDAPHLLGPEPLSFARYLRAPEVRDWIIRQNDSHAMMMFEDFFLQTGLDGANGHGTPAVLMNVVARYAAEQPEGFRYWQRTKNVIWKPFVGLLNARQHNLKARRGEEEKLDRKNRRIEKEKVRLTMRRSQVNIGERKRAAIERLRIQAVRLVALAEKKEIKARKWRAQAETLTALAAQKDVEAVQIENEVAQAEFLSDCKKSG